MTYLRTEAVSVGEELLTPPQQQVALQVLNALTTAVGDLDTITNARDFAGRTMPAHPGTPIERRPNHTVFISGARGSGKTTLMLSLRKMTSASSDLHTEADDPKVRALRDNANRLRNRLVWLNPLPLETQPPDFNPLASILVRIEEVISYSLTRYEREPLGVSNVLTSDKIRGPMFELQSLQMDATLAWDSNLDQRKRYLDTEPFATEVIRSADARQSLGLRFATVLDHLAPLLQQKQALFVLPIDDFDLAPGNVMPVLRLIRLLSVPRLFFILLGEQHTLGQVYRLSRMKELLDHGAENGTVYDLAEDWSREGLRKLVPPTQRYDLRPFTVNEALAFQPLGISAQGDHSLKAQLDRFKFANHHSSSAGPATLAVLADETGHPFQGLLTERLRRLTDLWGYLRLLSDEVDGLEKLAWKVALDELEESDLATDVSRRGQSDAMASIRDTIAWAKAGALGRELRCPVRLARSTDPGLEIETEYGQLQVNQPTGDWKLTDLYRAPVDSDPQLRGAMSLLFEVLESSGRRTQIQPLDVGTWLTHIWHFEENAPVAIYFEPTWYSSREVTRIDLHRRMLVDTLQRDHPTPDRLHEMWFRQLMYRYWPERCRSIQGEHDGVVEGLRDVLLALAKEDDDATDEQRNVNDDFWVALVAGLVPEAGFSTKLWAKLSSHPDSGCLERALVGSEVRVRRIRRVRSDSLRRFLSAKAVGEQYRIGEPQNHAYRLGMAMIRPNRLRDQLLDWVALGLKTLQLLPAERASEFKSKLADLRDQMHRSLNDDGPDEPRDIFERITNQLSEIAHLVADDAPVYSDPLFNYLTTNWANSWRVPSRNEIHNFMRHPINRIEEGRLCPSSASWLTELEKK